MLFSDPFTQWLKLRGTPVEVYQPAGYLGGAPVGWMIQVRQSIFVYRINENAPEKLIIVLFERQNDRSGLRSPFTDIVRFISLVRQSGAPIHIIQGRVEALEKRPKDSLENERIAAFYQRYLAAWHVFRDDGIDWFAGDLRTYVPPLAAERQWLEDESSVSV